MTVLHSSFHHDNIFVDLQSKLLREDLELEKVVHHCSITEQSDINAKLLMNENEEQVN